MKNLLLGAMISLLLMGSWTDSNFVDKELENIQDIVYHHDLEIDEWDVTIKEKVDSKQAQNFMKKLQTDYQLSKQENSDGIIYTYTSREKNDDVVESYRIIQPDNSTNQIELVAILNGHTWNHEIKANYYKWYQNMMNAPFTEASQTYTCVSTKFDGIIKSDYFLEDMFEKLDVKHKQTQTDNNSHTMLENIYYGYTPLWSQKINILDTPMNLQVAVTKNEFGASRFIIGTPILINEY